MSYIIIREFAYSQLIMKSIPLLRNLKSRNCRIQNDLKIRPLVSAVLVLVTWLIYHVSHSERAETCYGPSMWSQTLSSRCYPQLESMGMCNWRCARTRVFELLSRSNVYGSRFSVTCTKADLYLAKRNEENAKTSARATTREWRCEKRHPNREMRIISEFFYSNTAVTDADIFTFCSGKNETSGKTYWIVETSFHLLFSANWRLKNVCTSENHEEHWIRQRNSTDEFNFLHGF